MMKLARTTAVLLIIAVCTSFCVFGKALPTNYATRVTEVNSESYATGKTTLEDGASYLIYTVSATMSHRKLLGNTKSGLKLLATPQSTFAYPSSMESTEDWSANLWTVEITDAKNHYFKLKNPAGQYLATSTEDKNYAVILTTAEEGFHFQIDANGRLKALESDRCLAASTTKDVWFVPRDAAQQTKYEVCFYQVLGWSAESEAVGYTDRIGGEKKDLAAVRFVFDCGLSDADVERSYIVYTDFNGTAGREDEEPESGSTKIVVSDNGGLGSFYGDVDEIDFLGTAYALGCVKVGGKYYWSPLKSQEIAQLGEVEE